VVSDFCASIQTVWNFKDFSKEVKIEMKLNWSRTRQRLKKLPK
jgi:hypothetical protein